MSEEKTAVAAFDWSQQTGLPTGMENVTQKDLGIPFLTIIQKGSPQVDESHSDYETKGIPGASAGDLLVTTTNQIVGSRKAATPVLFIPCGYEKMYVEWKDRDKGGGFVKSHRNENVLADCTRNAKGIDVLPDGNTIVPTAYFYGLVCVDGEWKPTVIGLTSTQLSKARKWLNIATSLKLTVNGQRFTPPMYSHIYNLTTVAESNDKGSWYGWQIGLNGPVASAETAQKAIDTAKDSSWSRAQQQQLPEESSRPLPF